MNQSVSEKIKHGRPYRPSEAYRVLLMRSPRAQHIVAALIETTKFAIPTNVLKPGNREERTDRISDLIPILYQKTKKILHDAGLSSITSQVDQYTEIETIASLIKDPQKRSQVIEEITEVARVMSADILDALGFLSLDEFDRASLHVAPHIHNTQIDPLTDPFEKLLPSWFAIDDVRHVERKMPEWKERDVVNEAPPFIRLGRWIIDANDDFLSAQHDAARNLEGIITALKGDHEGAQLSGLLAGLDTRPFIELIKIALNTDNPRRRRFEALRLLKWSIAIFSVKRNPVYKAAEKVRGRIDAILGGVLVDKSRMVPMPIDDEMMKRIRAEEYDEPPESDPVIEPWKARGVRESAQKEFLDPTETVKTDACTFDQRLKEVRSAVMKMMLYQLMIDKVHAFLDGRDTDLPADFTLDKAHKKLRIARTRLARSRMAGVNDVMFKLKPVALESEDDLVANQVGLWVDEPLADIQKDPVKKQALEDTFVKLAQFIIRELCIEDAEPENNLWKEHTNNHLSSPYFRDYKFNGFVRQKMPIYREGHLVEDVVRVPVEFQLVPVETAIRLRMKGKTGRARYSASKMKDLADDIIPAKIANRPVYGSSAEGTPEVAMVAEMLS